MQTKPKLRFKDKNGNAYPEWKEFKIKDIGNISMCKRVFKEQTSSKGEIPFYKIGTFGKTPDAYISRKLFQELKTKYSYPQIGAILISASGTIGRTVEYKGEDAYFQDSNIIWINHDNKIKDKFLKLLLQNTDWDKVVEGSTIKRLYNNNLLKIKVPLPCIDEQEKIAGFLSKVDELINECEGEVKDLEEQKKGLMQKIFSQQIRFKDSNKNPYPDWEEKVMSDILNEYCKKNSIANQYPVLTSSKQGLMLQTEYYSGENRITEKDNIGFNIIPPNYITYRSRSDDGLFTFNINNLGVTGMVSTYYPVFSTNYNNLFVMTYLNINKNNLFKYAVGSSQKVLSLNELKKVKIKLPCLEEQEKIAKVLSKIYELIEEKKALLSDWQQFKKGLLQQMFV